MHLTRNQAYLHGYRGFKSLPLRQHTKQNPTRSRRFPSLIKRSCTGFTRLPRHVGFKAGTLPPCLVSCTEDINPVKNYLTAPGCLLRLSSKGAC
jgi:hypothetical protein